jgi:hypothetical protein
MRNAEQDWLVDGVLMGAQLLLTHHAIAFSAGFRDLDVEKSDIVETGPDGQAFDWELFGHGCWLLVGGSCGVCKFEL